MNMLDAGQLACMVSVRACPCAAMPCSAPASNSAPASATRFDPVFGLRMVLLLSRPMLLGGHGHFKGHANIRPAYQRGADRDRRAAQEAHDHRDPRIQTHRGEDGLHL